MKNLVDEVNNTAIEIQKLSNYITFIDAMQIAVQIQRNRILSYAFVVNGTDTPSALEKIAMQLGAAKDELISSTINCVEENLQPDNKKKWLSKKEVSSLFSVSILTIDDWCDKGILNYYTIGSRVRFSRSEVEQAITKINQHPKKD